MRVGELRPDDMVAGGERASCRRRRLSCVNARDGDALSGSDSVRFRLAMERRRGRGSVVPFCRAVLSRGGGGGSGSNSM